MSLRKFPSLLILLLSLTLTGCGGDEDAKSESKTSAAAKTGSGQDPKPNEGTAVAGSQFDGTVLAVKLDVPAILQQVKVALEKGDNPSLMMAAGMVGMVEGLKLETVTAYLHQIDGATVYPVVVFNDSSGGLLGRVKGNPFVGAFLEDAGGDHRIAFEKMSAAEDAPEQFKALRIRQLDNAVAIGVPAILDALKDKSWSPDSSFTTELAKPLDRSLVSISLVVPEKPQEWLAAWAEDDSLSNPELNDMKKGMLQASQGLNQMADQIAPLRGVAIGVSVDDQQTFGLSGVIASHSPELVQKLQGLINDPPLDQLPGPVVRLLKSDLIQPGVTVDGNNLRWSLSWDAEAQEQLATKMVGPLMMSMFLRGGRNQSPAEEGPITPKYTDAPVFVENVDPEKLKADITNHFKTSIFPMRDFRRDSMWLELDPIAIPFSDMVAGSYEIVELKDEAGNDLLGQPEKNSRLSFRQHTENIIVNAKPGTKAEQLTTAKIKFKVKLPIVQVFEVTAENIDQPQTKGGVTLELTRIERNMVNASIDREEPLPEREERRFVQPQVIAAFDSEGRCLDDRGWSSFGDSQVEADFHGEVTSVKFGVVEKYIDLEAEVEIDLNGGKALKLSDEPADNVPVRREWQDKEEFETTDPDAMEGLKVEWVENESARESGLKLALPSTAKRHNAIWELVWLSKNGPSALQGHGGMQSGGGIQWRPGNHEELQSMNAVVGQVQVHVATNVETITIEAKDGSDWQEVKLADGESAFLKIEKQVVSWSLPDDARLLTRNAYDAEGLRLHGQFQEKYIQLEAQKRRGRSSPYWGYPQKAELVISRKVISKIYPIEIVKRELPAAQLESLKKQAEDLKAVAKVVQKIAKARNSDYDAADDIAGLHYLYPIKKEEPGQLISKEIADACASDAERYGFEAKPYRGYHFDLLRKKYEGEKLVDVKRRDQTKKRKWAKGEIEFKPFSGSLGIVARPVDPKLPTLIFNYNTFMKTTGDEAPQAIPSDIYQWPQINLADPEAKPQI